MTKLKLFAVTSIFLFACSQLRAANSPGSTGLDLLGQIGQAFAPQTHISNVSLSGTAQWYAGGLQDSGNATLTAASDGSSQMQLDLAKTGLRTESQTAIGPSMTCQWAGADASPHVLHTSSCLRPMVWFLPAMALQQSSLLTLFAASDLGTGATGIDSYRHAQLQFSASAFADASGPQLIEASTTDMALDPVSLLPQVVTYRISPDDGSQVEVSIEIHFSDYRAVNGAQVPFRIQRYVNGTLQLDFTATTAQVN